MVKEGERKSRRDVRPETEVEKRLEVQGSIALWFVDLDKAFDTVPKEIVVATLRWMGVPEAEVRMVERTYEMTIARMVMGEGASMSLLSILDCARCCS